MERGSTASVEFILCFFRISLCCCVFLFLGNNGLDAVHTSSLKPNWMDNQETAGCHPAGEPECQDYSLYQHTQRAEEV